MYFCWLLYIPYGGLLARSKHYYVGPDVLDPASTGIENELVINDRHIVRVHGMYCGGRLLQLGLSQSTVY